MELRRPPLAFWNHALVRNPMQGVANQAGSTHVLSTVCFRAENSRRGTSASGRLLVFQPAIAELESCRVRWGRRTVDVRVCSGPAITGQ